MSHDRWHEIKAVFQAALDRPPDDRESFVVGRCDDESAREEVMRLLRLHEQPGEFLETPVETPPTPTPAPAPAGIDPLIGRQIGDFRIGQRIGAGGMGAVYQAKQDRPHRTAAVKVLRPEFATRSMLRRLEFESEILARLQHPGIAHVYAAGTFDLGDGPRPWFAMELVNGPTLHAYAKEHLSNVAQKIELLLQICDAVQHAHQRGVIHRDLKPANILLAVESSKPQNEADQSLGRDPKRGPSGRSPIPKILDFGVARVIDANVQSTMHTTAGELVGTLSYMSPEQLSDDPNAVDARCDVYALGVMGYELLAGQSPHAPKTSAVAEIIRAITHEEPKPLGTRDPRLRGDLEAVFAKALEKEPARRYQSAAEFAADLRRYLNHEPVLVRPATMLYQFRKFARRNRALVGGTVATMIALSAGIVMYGLEAAKAREEASRSRYEADKATAINSFIINDFIMKLLAAANARDSDRRLPVAELVDRAAENIGVMFADQPLAKAAVRNEVASIYYNLGAFEKAARQFDLALKLWESHLGPDHVDTLKAVNNLGQTLAFLRRPDDAEALYRRALDGRLRALGEDDPYTLVSMQNLATLLRDTGRLDEAETTFRRVLETQRRVHGPSHKHTLITMANLGGLLLKRGKLDEALSLHRAAYEAARNTLGRDHVTTLVAGARLGAALRRADQLAEAEDLLTDIVQASDRTLGPDHGETITARQALAQVYQSQGNLNAAADQLRQALKGASVRPERSKSVIDRIQRDLDAITHSSPTTQSRN